MQVVSAIPKYLIELAQKSHIDKINFLCPNLFQLAPDVSLNLLKMKNKDYYWLLINNEKQQIKASSNWKRDLQIDETTLETSFTRVKSICSDNKLSASAQNCSHKKRIVHLWYRGQLAVFILWTNDSIIHTFSKCHWTQFIVLP